MYRNIWLIVKRVIMRGAMTSQVALKEGSAVVEALAAGRQLLLLRKGGIRDPKGMFELENREFLLYPTWEHQEPAHLRAEYRKWLRPPPVPSAPIEFRLYAGVAFTQQIRDPEVLDSLTDYHIWTPEFIVQRMSYRPASPTLLAAVRAYRLKKPVLQAAHPEYAGCKSWVPLAEPISLRGAEPVVDNRSFRAALEKIAGTVSS